MRAGRLDRRVAVQRFTATQSPSGEPIETWSTIAIVNRWASKTSVLGIERYGSQELEAKEQVEFRLRWSSELADLQPADRIVEPASDAIEPVPLRSIYDIFAVLEINRREGLRVLASRRPSQLPAETVEVVRSGAGLAIGIGGGYAIFEPNLNYLSAIGTAASVAGASAIGRLLRNGVAQAAGVGAAAGAGHEIRFRAGVAAGIGAAAAVGSNAWVQDFITPSGIAPSIVLDFLNNRYYDGSSSSASLASLLNNASGLIDASGLNVSGHTDLTSNGAFTTAIQQSGGTILVEAIGGDEANNASLVGFSTGAPDGPILFDAATLQPFAWNGVALRTQSMYHPATTWARLNRVASGWDGSGRRIVSNDGFRQGTGGFTDAGVYAARGQAVIGSWNSIFVYPGHIRRVVVWPTKVPNDDMLAVTWLSKYLFPLRRYHMIINSSADGGGGYATLTPGALQFERTQPWTFNCEWIRPRTGLAAVLFTNVNSLGPPWFGWEVWSPDTGEIRVHLMCGWDQVTSAHSLQVNSTTHCTAGDFYRIQVTYDGSSTAAGIKIYINGVLETNVVDHNSLDASIINGTHQVFISDQYPGGIFDGGHIGPFQISNVVRDAAYAAAMNSRERTPDTDSNHVVSFDMSEGSGLTLHDKSASGLNGTLNTTNAWEVWSP